MKMDSKTKKMFGIFLGETLEIKTILKGKKLDKSERATLYALKNGFESVINDYLDEDWYITIEEEKIVANVLTPYFNNEEKLNELKGFYDIEPELEEKGISRLKALAIMKYYYAKGSFISVLNKMDTTHSPQECRTFEISDYDI